MTVGKGSQCRGRTARVEDNREHDGSPAGTARVEALAEKGGGEHEDEGATHEGLVAGGQMVAHVSCLSTQGKCIVNVPVASRSII